MRFLLLYLALLVLYLTPPIASERAEQGIPGEDFDFDEYSGSRTHLYRSPRDTQKEDKEFGDGEATERKINPNKEENKNSTDSKTKSAHFSYSEVHAKLIGSKIISDTMKEENKHMNDELEVNKKEHKRAKEDYDKKEAAWKKLQKSYEKMESESGYTKHKEDFDNAKKAYAIAKKNIIQKEKQLETDQNELKISHTATEEARMKAQKVKDNPTLLNEERAAKTNMPTEQQFQQRKKDLDDKKLKENYDNAKTQYDYVMRKYDNCGCPPNPKPEKLSAQCKTAWNEVSQKQPAYDEAKSEYAKNYWEIEWLDAWTSQYDLYKKKIGERIAQLEKDTQGQAEKERQANEDATRAEKEETDLKVKVQTLVSEILTINKEMNTEQGKEEEAAKEMNDSKYDGIRKEREKVDTAKEDFEKQKQAKDGLERKKKYLKIALNETDYKIAQAKTVELQAIYDRMTGELEEKRSMTRNFIVYGVVLGVFFLPILILTVISCTRLFYPQGPKNWDKIYVKLRTRNYRNKETKGRIPHGMKMGRKFFHPVWPWEIDQVIDIKGIRNGVALYKRRKRYCKLGFFGKDLNGPNPTKIIDPPRAIWRPKAVPGQSNDSPAQLPIEQSNRKNRYAPTKLPVVYPELKPSEELFRRFYYNALHMRHDRLAKAKLKYRMHVHKRNHKYLYTDERGAMKAHKPEYKKKDPMLKKMKKKSKKKKKIRSKSKALKKKTKTKKTKTKKSKKKSLSRNTKKKSLKRDKKSRDTRKKTKKKGLKKNAKTKGSKNTGKKKKMLKPKSRILQVQKREDVKEAVGKKPHKNYTRMLYIKYRMELYKICHRHHRNYQVKMLKTRHQKRVKQPKVHNKVHKTVLNVKKEKKKHRRKYRMKLKRRYRKRVMVLMKSVKEEKKKEEKKKLKEEIEKKDSKKVVRKKKKHKKAHKKRVDSAMAPEVRIPDADVNAREDATQADADAAPVFIWNDNEQKTQENTRTSADLYEALNVPEDKTQTTVVKTVTGQLPGPTTDGKGNADEDKTQTTAPLEEPKSSLTRGGGKKSDKSASHV